MSGSISLVAHWYAISLANTVLPIPGAPSIRIRLGVSVKLVPLSVWPVGSAANMSDMFLVTLNVSCGLSVEYF